MNYFFRTALLLLLAGSPALVTTSCSSEKKEDPQPTTGSLSGTVSPAGALSKVTATDAGGLTFMATPDATGSFTIADLKPGAYTLTFMPTNGYATPAQRSITIVAGQTAAAGTVLVVGDGTPRGTISWTVDGQSFTSTSLSGVVRAAGELTEISATATSGNVAHRVSFEFNRGITGLGTYNLFQNGPDYNAGYYTTTTGTTTVGYGTYFVPTGPTTGHAGGGSFEVTSFNATGRTMSGTFNYSAINANDRNNVLRKNITNGSFTIQY